MNVEKQAVKLVDEIKYEDLLEKIEKCGRICYQSEGYGEPERFVSMLIKRGHESVLEHVNLTFKITTNRNISHELVRHRIASYSQESTRYVKYSDLTFIPADLEYNAEFLEGAAQVYKQKIKCGVPPEIARDYLPGCLKTELYMTMNLRELRHFIQLRMTSAAHPQMRELAAMIFLILRDKYPVIVNE